MSLVSIPVVVTIRTVAAIAVFLLALLRATYYQITLFLVIGYYLKLLLIIHTRQRVKRASCSTLYMQPMAVTDEP